MSMERRQQEGGQKTLFDNLKLLGGITSEGETQELLKQAKKQMAAVLDGLAVMKKAADEARRVALEEAERAEAEALARSREEELSQAEAQQGADESAEGESAAETETADMPAQAAADEAVPVTETAAQTAPEAAAPQEADINENAAAAEPEPPASVGVQPDAPAAEAEGEKPAAAESGAQPAAAELKAKAPKQDAAPAAAPAPAPAPAAAAGKADAGKSASQKKGKVRAPAFAPLPPPVVREQKAPVHHAAPLPPPPAEVKKPVRKSADEKFLESLPKPIDSSKKRFIDLTPEPPKRTETGIKRYVPDQSGGDRRAPRPGMGTAPGARAPGGAPRAPGGMTGGMTGGPARRPLSTGITPPPSAPAKGGPSKKKGDKSYEAPKTAMNKRTLIRRGFEIDPTLIDEDARMGARKVRRAKKEEVFAPQPVKIEIAYVSTKIIPIKLLSDKLGITAVDITKRLFKDGVIKTINETLDYETAALLAMDLGITLEFKPEKTAEDILAEFHEEDGAEDMEFKKRPPVVTVMGHVDHGKTSLLDAIRQTDVVKGEAGGITQHIGAYTIKCKNELITFIDTPGHEAFTSMRARGASITDIAILVVAADDGIMPQTVEAINHAKAASVPVIVAINKMDKPTANPERIKQQLTEHNIIPEEWGGDAIICPVSAHTGEGLDHLLEMVLLLAEMRELKAVYERKAKGTIIEAKLDKGKGPMATVLVQNGTLRVGDTVVAGTTTGRVRAMLDDKGKNVKEAGPSIAVSILGLSEVPGAGDPLFSVDDEKLTRLVAEERLNKIKTDMVKAAEKVTLDDVFGKIAEGQVKGLNIIVKGDVHGSVEAVVQALVKLSNAEVKVNIIHSGVGAIIESDVSLARTASAIIIGFSVRPDANSRALADREGVDIRLYRVIYEITEDITAAMKGMLAPKFKEVIYGQAEVRNVFKITGVGVISGSYVTSGKIVRSAKVRLLRDNIVIAESSISSLKRFKEDVKEVAQGYECGIGFENYNDIKEHDVIECFQMEEIKQ